MMKKIVITTLLMLSTIVAFAQRTPDWVTNIPSPGNNTYFYVVESAFGDTELQARNQAFARVFQSTAMRLGQPISAEEINRAVQSGTSYSVLSRQYNIPINKVCEYTENKSGTYRVYILCQVAKSATIPVRFDGFSACYEGANKFYAEEALDADGFDVYKNGRIIGEREARSLFANSKASSYYDRGMSIYHSEFWNNNGGKGLSSLELLGGISLVVGGFMAFFCYLNAYSEENSSHSDNYAESVEKSKQNAQLGLKIAAVGGAVLLVGIGVKSYGKIQIRKAVNMYNNGALYTQNAIEMNYGFTGNGVFLSLNL